MCHDSDQTYFRIVSKFQLQCIWKATVVWNLAIYGVNYHLPVCISSQTFCFQFVLLQGAVEHQCWKVRHFAASVCVDEINHLLPVPHICIQGLEMFGGHNDIVAIRRPKNDNYGRCICLLRWVTSRFVIHALAHISCQPLGASPLRNFCPLNFACTFLQKHDNPQPPNSFSINENIQQQPVLACCQKIPNCSLPGQRSILNKCETVLPSDNGVMLFLQHTSHPYFYFHHLLNTR